MLKKLFTLSLMLLFASSFALAQGTHVLQANGDLIKLKDARNLQEALTVSKFLHPDGRVATNGVVKGSFDPTATPDTLNYPDYNYNTNFGFFDGDVMLQFFEAPADLIIKGAGFSCSDDAGSANSDIAVRLLKLNWTWEELTGVAAPQNIGVYPSEGDGLGETDPFGEDATGNWVDLSEGAYPLPPWDTDVVPSAEDGNFEQYDLWSDGGFGWPITAELQGGGQSYQWVDMSNLFEPEVAQGEVFAVAFVHEGTTAGSADRIGFFSAGATGISGWKYYEEGRLAAGDGWWVRDYTWDFAVAVELTGDRAPVVSGVTSLVTTVDEGPQTVEATITDDNPSGGAAGVASAEIHVSINGGDFSPVAMTDQGNDLYSGDIPGQTAGTEITYKIVATDVEGGVTESPEFNYKIFEVVNTDLLVIFNGGDEGRALQLAPFYVQGLVDAYDVWAGYGPVGDFINSYASIIEVGAEGGPNANNQAALAAYAASGGKNLAVIGMETLGFLNGYTDSTFVEGDYEYDILGVLNSYNDVNYDAVAGVGQGAGSMVMPIAGTMFGDSLAAWVSDSGIDTLLFSPPDILGSDNWMDQFDPRDDIGSEVFMHGFALDGTERPVGHSYTHPVGTEIFFTSYDDITLYDPVGDLWPGNSTLTPIAQFVRSYIVDVKPIDDAIPNRFSLSQNYPNPFNPTTSINFAISKSGLTTLKVYNILGQEVATLVNKDLSAGSYSVDFDARELSSGMYIYTIKNGDVEISKKMMLMK